MHGRSSIQLIVFRSVINTISSCTVQYVIVQTRVEELENTGQGRVFFNELRGVLKSEEVSRTTV